MVRLTIVALVFIGVDCVIGSGTAAPADSARSPQWEQSDLGETAFVPMDSAPYPHPSREKGFVYNKALIPREPHYTDSTVGLFVPRGYRRTSKVNLLVYLHGWSSNVRTAIGGYKLREQIAASGQNIILVFPEGPRDATDSDCGKLEDKDGLKHLLKESLATLHAAGKIDRETLGHVLSPGTAARTADWRAVPIMAGSTQN